jgi:hypothetical protein
MLIKVTGFTSRTVGGKFFPAAGFQEIVKEAPMFGNI